MTEEIYDAVGYVRKARQESQDYVLELQLENDRLRLKVQSLESDVNRYREERLSSLGTQRLDSTRKKGAG